jgi:hypothetical protein
VTETSEAPDARLPLPEDPDSAPDSPARLLVFGDDDDTLVCVDDTCLPPGARE